MKHIIFFLFTTLSVVATAQEATKDSSVIISKNGLFFNVRYQEFANGESSVVTTLLGDTSAVIGKNSEEIRNKTSSWASDIEYTSSIPQKINEMIRKEEALKTIVGKSALDALRTETFSWPDSTYKMKTTSGTFTLKFSTPTVNGVKILRYKLDTFAVRQADYLGKAIRFRNFQNTGRNLYMVQFPSGRWFNSDRTIQFFTQAQGPGSRAIQPEPVDIILPQQQQNATPEKDATGKKKKAGKSGKN